MARVFVAAAGGGDALVPVLIHSATADGEDAVSATYACERLRVDPRPGRRVPGAEPPASPTGQARSSISVSCTAAWPTSKPTPEPGALTR